MIKYVVEVTQRVAVTLDEARFDDEFMESFNDSIADFGDDLERHAQHLGQLYARGIVDNGDFMEGYGHADDMGVTFEEEWTEAEVISSKKL